MVAISGPGTQEQIAHPRITECPWDYAMWCGDVPTQRNPMELLSIAASQRIRKPNSLTAEKFQSLLAPIRDGLVFPNDVACGRTQFSMKIGCSFPGQDRTPADQLHARLGKSGCSGESCRHISSRTFRHTHRTWLDSVGTPVGVQPKLMRHADIRTTMNLSSDAISEDMRQARQRIVRLALLNGSQNGSRNG